MNAIATKPRFSGHETFACRFSWLPKAVRLIEENPSALADDEAAILSLGLGKYRRVGHPPKASGHDEVATVGGHGCFIRLGIPMVRHR